MAVLGGSVFDSALDLWFLWGSGTPVGEAGANRGKGSIYIQTDGASGSLLWLKTTTGNINAWSSIRDGIKTLTLGSYLTGGSYNGSADVTTTVDATSAATASKVVVRDASGDFAAHIITAALAGNASTASLAALATALQTARAINGVNFDGTAAITVAAAAGTLTGATLASGVTASSLTSLGTLATNLLLAASKTLVIATGGAADTVGQATLVGGTKTINTTSALGTWPVFLSRKTLGGGGVGTLSYTVVDGTSFTINSSDGTDTSIVNWWILGKS